jgi:hypothetical protein
MSPRAHPWQTLIEAALAYAAAETEDEFRRAAWRLAKAAKRYRDEPRGAGRPRTGDSEHAKGAA